MSHLPPQPISPLDGRYRAAVDVLGEYLSEAALNRLRVEVEIEWLIALTRRGLFGTEALGDATESGLRRIVADFGSDEIAELAAEEAITRHDVKAIEYFIRRRLVALGLANIAELTHFAATSEDINNLAYSLGLQRTVSTIWLPRFDALVTELTNVAQRERATPMLAHTHGQPATPTTFGKEIAVVVGRLQRVRRRVLAVEYLGKFNGATGTYAAHVAAAPEADWPAISRGFVEGLGLTWNPLTTQIESHDAQAELYGAMSHINRILHNLCTDIWAYISMGYLAQTPVEGATGSSTMPHKVNPIRFENAEANLELSTAVFDSLAATLTTSRLQRDLTDSTTQRNIGVAFGHSLIALDNLLRGLGEISVANGVLEADLEHNWEVLAEAIQTVIRAEVTAGRSTIPDPYALLKELTRGHRITADELRTFIAGLDIGDEAKGRLLALSPAGYVGLASALVDYLD